ncbi:hypothetical protein JAAARDRAFT_557626 [Jaapia argillacea MUCL 33604]|uniref:Uncharacterized protein n=1 Tax=Jaapia argillacea MUCL 33604 TaxID=933084 RepID=A0A067Q3B8_9AGAM|nr:hypothetical protein JAAARDRAFT_557626 [Jaapia argillacea MUCL 33604]
MTPPTRVQLLCASFSSLISLDSSSVAESSLGRSLPVRLRSVKSTSEYLPSSDSLSTIRYEISLISIGAVSTAQNLEVCEWGQFLTPCEVGFAYYLIVFCASTFRCAIGLGRRWKISEGRL